MKIINRHLVLFINIVFLMTTTTFSQAVGKYADVNGIKMYYEIHGTGEPLVLIHGGGSTIRTTFGRILPVIAKSHKVIAVELQAHGHTYDRDAPETFEQDADDVAELLRQLNISSADIFGFSNGGNTAMQIAIRHPERVRKLILASAFYKRDGIQPWFWDFMNQATIKDMPQVYKDEYLSLNHSQAELQNMHDKDLHRMQSFKDWKDEDIKSIKAPAFIIIGDKDVVRPEHAVEMHRLIQHSRLAILPASHGSYIGEIMYTEMKTNLPEQVVVMIEEFLSEPMPAQD